MHKANYSIKLAVPISSNKEAQVTVNMIPTHSFIFTQNCTSRILKAMQYDSFLTHSIICRSRTLQTVSILYNSKDISKDLKLGGVEGAEEGARVWI